jgi:hypothetical protein
VSGRQRPRNIPYQHQPCLCESQLEYVRVAMPSIPPQLELFPANLVVHSAYLSSVWEIPEQEAHIHLKCLVEGRFALLVAIDVQSTNIKQ